MARLTAQKQDAEDVVTRFLRPVSVLVTLLGLAAVVQLAAGVGVKANVSAVTELRIALLAAGVTFLVALPLWRAVRDTERWGLWSAALFAAGMITFGTMYGSVTDEVTRLPIVLGVALSLLAAVGIILGAARRRDRLVDAAATPEP